MAIGAREVGVGEAGGNHPSVLVELCKLRWRERATQTGGWGGGELKSQPRGFKRLEKTSSNVSMQASKRWKRHDFEAQGVEVKPLNRTYLLMLPRARRSSSGPGRGAPPPWKPCASHPGRRGAPAHPLLTSRRSSRRRTTGLRRQWAVGGHARTC